MIRDHINPGMLESQQARRISGSFSAMARCSRRSCGSIARPFLTPPHSLCGFPHDSTPSGGGMFRRQGPGRVGRAQVLETTEASSGRILPFLKLLEILRSFTIGSRAGAKTPPAPCVQAARAPSLRPRPGAVTARPAVADWDAWRCRRLPRCGAAGRRLWRPWRVARVSGWDVVGEVL